MNTPAPDSERWTRWGLAGAIASAAAASVCCLGPLVLLALGVSGAWIGTLSAFEPYRPLFVVVTACLLAVAFHRVYRKPKAEACAPGTYCVNAKAERINKVSLWTVTALAAAMLAAPSLLGRSAVGAGAEPPSGALRAVTLDMTGMTCGACAVTTKKALEGVEGVRSADVTLEPPRAVVVYDSGRVAVENIVRATTNAGYPSVVHQ
ncbi:MAG: cation transporter [Candidatus Methylomirabilis sp.]|nr:cation transporter [Deltaproteobacteria bacterium]